MSWPFESTFPVQSPFAASGPLTPGFVTVPLTPNDCSVILQSPVCTPSGESGGRFVKVAVPPIVDFGTPFVNVTFCVSTSLIVPDSGVLHVNAPESPVKFPVHVPPRPVKTAIFDFLQIVLPFPAFAQTTNGKRPGAVEPVGCARSESQAGWPVSLPSVAPTAMPPGSLPGVFAILNV